MTFTALMISACFLTIGLAAAQLPGPGTETVHIVAHVKAGHEAEYAKLSGEAWALYKRLGLVLDKPHVVLRGTDEKGRAYFVEVFTWKSSDIPDHAPAAVKAIWQQLENVCEVRDGRPGIDFSEVTTLQLD
ncbi:MAG TPA: hypothetical protein VG322_01515 [Candidatus Acidoferrales bacterium]|nr:hypothetical protein [Candidatus Acidoferrales bacterium]